jgi:RNA polymerase sigma-70 factor, ECF subfamily
MAGKLDRKEFEALFRSRFQPLSLYGVRFVKDLDIAREIVQESFLALWEKRETMDGERSITGYLATSVRNRCLNYLRDNRKFVPALLEAEHLYPDLTYTPPDALAGKELMEQIQSAIDELPERCREVFLLSRNDSLKYQEIAERLEISVKTVETQMSKALQHLRMRLGGYLTALVVLFSFFSDQG